MAFSPFHVDGVFSPYRALLVAVLAAVVLCQVVAMTMLVRGQVAQAAARDAQVAATQAASAPVKGGYTLAVWPGDAVNPGYVAAR